MDCDDEKVPRTLVKQLQLLPAIIVLNEKYFPDSATSEAAKVGATSFALSAAMCLADAGVFAGMLLYKRREDIVEPVIKAEAAMRNGIVCSVLAFNFHMGKAKVKAAVRSAALRLAARDHTSDLSMLPMLYYQTDTLLGYHPDGIPSCVTHHGPFFADLVQHFSVDKACLAFGSANKAMHLMRHQKAGLQYLLHRVDMFVLQHSDLQGKSLLRYGVDPNRIRQLRPPIQAAAPNIFMKMSSTTPISVQGSGFCDDDDQRLVQFVSSTSSCEVLLFTAVARLDFFKNVELLVDAGVELLDRRGMHVRVLVVGGDAGDDDLRASILGRVPSRYAQQFMAVQKLPKQRLYSLFHRARDKGGVFVCTSRYETLGITPLEAAVNGVNTLMVHSYEQVEASKFFPESHLFGDTVSELAEAVAQLHGKDMAVLGEALHRHVEKLISLEMFRVDLLLAWSHFSDMILSSAAT